MACAGPVTPATVIAVTPPPQAPAAPRPPPAPQPVTEPEQEEQPARVVAVEEAAYPRYQPPAMMSPQPLATAAQLPPTAYMSPMPGVYTPALAQSAMPVPATVMPPQTAPVASATPPSTMMQLQVLVPAPGLNPGQQLAFLAPMGPGQPSKQMVVKVHQGAAPGAVVTVQYLVPATAAVAPGLSLPNPTTSMAPEHAEDQNTTFAGWLLFGAGFACMCFMPPFGLLLWGLGSALYFCKPPQRRAQLRQSRKPAYANLIICLTCVMMGLALFIGMSIALIADEELQSLPDPMDHHHHPHHHHGNVLKFMHPVMVPTHHNKWEDRAITGEEHQQHHQEVMHGKKRCPFARFKKMMRQFIFNKPNRLHEPPVKESDVPAPEGIAAWFAGETPTPPSPQSELDKFEGWEEAAKVWT